MKAGTAENSFRDLWERGAKKQEMSWKGTWGQGERLGGIRAHLSANGTEPVGESSPSQRAARAQGLPKNCLTDAQRSLFRNRWLPFIVHLLCAGPRL